MLKSLFNFIEKRKSEKLSDAYESGYEYAAKELLKSNGDARERLWEQSDGIFNTKETEYKFDKGIRGALEDWHDLAKERGNFLGCGD